MPDSGRITSRQHPVVREFRQVARRGETPGLVLLDGEHLLREALAAGIRVRTVLSAAAPADLVTEATAAGASVYGCPGNVLEAASPVRTPSGIVAIAEWTPSDLETIFRAQPALVVGLVNVQDPGNVGSSIRSADALGATGVLALDATADPSSWKVLRGSMGSAFRLPIARTSLQAGNAAARQAGARILATTAASGRPVDEADLRAPAVILFGHEGLGLPPHVVAEADEAISIPMRTGIDSLNVAVATALVLDAARRQRQGLR